MDKIVIKEDVIPGIGEIIHLYEDVEWSAYTNNPENLKLAIDKSLKVWTVWDDDKLVGLARVVGDGCTIIYIQDVLVLESYQRQGIGSELIKLILEKYKKVRQVLLMTDETEKTVRFYKKCGLINARDYKIVTFIK